jgi:hypothetical protein
MGGFMREWIVEGGGRREEATGGEVRPREMGGTLVRAAHSQEVQRRVARRLRERAGKEGEGEQGWRACGRKVARNANTEEAEAELATSAGSRAASTPALKQWRTSP